ncbi:hypothetical protein [Draconibacterium sediminis]|uniref:Uncharacterized protein n=1 Tax=Draconibacterium sediminis TaxID=1544798 RepID=A0A0D8JC52_9BACT|nr:hypothetical protein [Draconibacterium sediminis]KJF44502.1 hypothetical protein LH29_03170 [Draconibacterium sediminis]
MRKLLYIALFIVAMLACEDREPEPIIVPSWMKAQLAELEDSGNCYGCRVQRWTYNEEYFYHLYCDHWSCSNCEVYHNNGTLVEWGVTVDPVDFDSLKYRPTIVWECGDELE